MPCLQQVVVFAVANHALIAVARIGKAGSSTIIHWLKASRANHHHFNSPHYSGLPANERGEMAATLRTRVCTAESDGMLVRPASFQCLLMV